MVENTSQNRSELSLLRQVGRTGLPLTHHPCSERDDFASISDPSALPSLCWDRSGAALPLSRRCFAPAAGNAISSDTATPPRMAQLPRAAGHALLRLPQLMTGPCSPRRGTWFSLGHSGPPPASAVSQGRLCTCLGISSPLPFPGSLPALPQLTAPRHPFYAVTMSSYLLPIRQHKMASAAHG